MSQLSPTTKTRSRSTRKRLWTKLRQSCRFNRRSFLRCSRTIQTTLVPTQEASKPCREQLQDLVTKMVWVSSTKTICLSLTLLNWTSSKSVSRLRRTWRPLKRCSAPRWSTLRSQSRRPRSSRRGNLREFYRPNQKLFQLYKMMVTNLTKFELVHIHWNNESLKSTGSWRRKEPGFSTSSPTCVASRWLSSALGLRADSSPRFRRLKSLEFKKVSLVQWIVCRSFLRSITTSTSSNRTPPPLCRSNSRSSPREWTSPSPSSNSTPSRPTRRSRSETSRSYSRTELPRARKFRSHLFGRRRQVCSTRTRRSPSKIKRT